MPIRVSKTFCSQSKRRKGQISKKCGEGSRAVTYGDIAAGGLENLVHSLGAEGDADDACEGLAGVEPSKARLALLLPQDEERPAKLVEGQRHG